MFGMFMQVLIVCAAEEILTQLSEKLSVSNLVLIKQTKRLGIRTGMYPTQPTHFLLLLHAYILLCAQKEK